MKLKGQLQWSDYLNSSLLHMQPTGFVRFIVYFTIAIGILILVLAFYLAATAQVSIISLIPVLTFVIFIPIYRYVFLPNRVKKIFSQQKELSLPYDIEISDTGMIVSNEFGTVNRPWDNFHKWKENNDLLILYHSDVLYTILPKRIFSDAAQIENVKEYLISNQVPVAKSRFRFVYILIVLFFIIACWMMYQSSL